MRICQIILIGMIAASCADNLYEFHGKKYRIYQEKDLNKMKDYQAINLSNSTRPIPPAVFEQSELRILDLNNKNLQALPPELCRLQKLQVLLMKNNLGIQLPDCFDSLKQLEIISLLGCQLQQVPPQIKTLPKLRMLVIGGNRFSDSELAALRRDLPNTNIVVTVD
jgi:Leucine-rich repeat (LRR) protein